MSAGDITMSGGGAYSLATVGARHVIDAALPLVEDAIARVPAETVDGVFTFSDMGCADGGTSLGMVGRAIDAVRARFPEVAVRIVHTDQPRNDFNALARTVHGLSDFNSYLDGRKAVYPVFSATSFHRQILPPRSLHLGFSATAMHWLSARPCNIPDHVHVVGARGDELRAFAEHARADWQTILLCRAAELAPGGCLVLVNFCRDEQGRYLGNTGGVHMFDTFNRLWRDFAGRGVISEEEYRGMTLPQYYHTVEEFSAPFNDENSPVQRAGLRLHHIQTRIVRCPFARDFARHGDAARFADEYIPTIRSWSQSIYLGALDGARPPPQRRAIIEQYYRAYHDLVAQDPAGHGMDYVHAYMIISKQP